MANEAPSGWGMLGAYVRRSWHVYLAGVSLTAGASVLAVWIPRLVGRFADRLEAGTLDRRGAAACAGAVVALGMARAAMAWTGRMLVHRRGRILTYELRRDLLRKWTTLPPAYHQRHGVGDLLSHALSDVEVVRELASMGVNVSATGLSMLAAALTMMALHGDPRLTLAALCPLAAIPFLVRRLGPRIRERSQRAQEALGAMAQDVEEAIGGIRAIKSFGNERVAIRRFEWKVDAIVAQKMAFARLSSLFGALVPLMANLGFVVVLGYGGTLVLRGTMSVGGFVAFTLYLAMLRGPLEHFGQVLNVVQRAAASLRRLSDLLRAVPAVADRPGPLLDRPIRGELRVERLTFRYPGAERPALEDVSFAVPLGGTVGIVGPTGSGKTTLASLLLRLHDPPQGTIFLDGVDVLRYPLARLRQAMAYVPQDGFLFSSSVLENVCFSDAVPDRERALRSARSASVDGDIALLADGFDTEIGERGVRLSGGQRQRLAIARSLYKDAAIQIFDDSLSAVDARTERAIVGNLRARRAEDARAPGGTRTTIVISHRLSAVRHSDAIVVLEDGRVVERGSHADLTREGGRYARLWWLQSGEREPPGAPRGPGRDAIAGVEEGLLGEEAGAALADESA